MPSRALWIIRIHPSVTSPAAPATALMILDACRQGAQVRARQPREEDQRRGRGGGKMTPVDDVEVVLLLQSR